MGVIKISANVQALAQWEVGFVRLTSWGMLLEFKSLKLPGFAQGSGQPQTAARLCFMLKYGCQAHIAANAAVGCSTFFCIFGV